MIHQLPLPALLVLDKPRCNPLKIDEFAETAPTIHIVQIRIPDALARNCRHSPDLVAWLERVPIVVKEFRDRWELLTDSPLNGEEGSCSYVEAVRRSDGTPAVLKISMPHMEQEHEAEGLRFWNGDPTVRLMESDDANRAMLMERCQPGTTLRVLDETEQDVLIAGLLRRLWRSMPAQHPFRPLSEMIEYWSNETLRRESQWHDAGLVHAGLRVFKELLDTSTTCVSLATDLHAGNVLRSERKPWLVIDPKPFVGDSAYDGTQHLFNCRARLRSDPFRTIRRFADLLSIDHERLRLWTFARAAAEPRDDWKNPELLDLARVLSP